MELTEMILSLDVGCYWQEEIILPAECISMQIPYYYLIFNIPLSSMFM